MSLSRKLKQLRKERGITQVDLAKMIGVERSSVGKYETGTMPSAEVLTSIAEYFNVTTDYLLGVTDSQPSPKRDAEVQKIINTLPLDLLDDEELQKLVEYAEFLVMQKKKKE